MRLKPKKLKFHGGECKLRTLKKGLQILANPLSKKAGATRLELATSGVTGLKTHINMCV